MIKILTYEEKEQAHPLSVVLFCLLMHVPLRIEASNLLGTLLLRCRPQQGAGDWNETQD